MGSIGALLEREAAAAQRTLEAFLQVEEGVEAGARGEALPEDGATVPPEAAEPGEREVERWDARRLGRLAHRLERRYDLAFLEHAEEGQGEVQVVGCRGARLREAGQQQRLPADEPRARGVVGQDGDEDPPR